METDFSKIIECVDGQQREFHFARVNSVAIYYHVSVLDRTLITATIAMDETGRWRLRESDLPIWFKVAEPYLTDAVEMSTSK